MSVYELAGCSFDKLLTRCTLPVRDVAVSPDGQWVAIASEYVIQSRAARTKISELHVKIINLQDPLQIIYIRDLPRSIKHVTFDPSGSYIAASGTDGNIYVYSLSQESPRLLHKVEEVIAALDGATEETSRAVWHPNGRTFAACDSVRDIRIVGYNDGEVKQCFTGNHSGPITDYVWSPNGAMLLSAANNDKLVLWDAETLVEVRRYVCNSLVSNLVLCHILVPPR